MFASTVRQGPELNDRLGRTILRRMRPAEEVFLARLRADPHANTRHLARELGLSNRTARRLVAQLTTERFVRAHLRRRALLVVVAFAGLAGSGYRLYQLVRSPLEPSPRTDESAAVERALYEALDRRDRSRTSEALEHLRSVDESVRLAALRYLTGVQVEHVEQIVPLVDDPSDRVRVAAIQLVARLDGPLVEEALVRVAVTAGRAQSERLVALAGLAQVASKAPARDLARSLLPAALDPSPAIRMEVGRVLEALTQARVDVGPTPPEPFHDAWASVLAASSS